MSLLYLLRNDNGPISKNITPQHPEIDYTGVTTARIISSFTSACSISGALLIILSYIIFKDIRTKARFILLHLSIGDFGVGCSNFIGAVVHFGQYIDDCRDVNHSLPLPCSSYIGLCQTQAFFAMFFTNASILWTLVLALYVYILVVDTGRRLSELLVRSAYVICWGLPFVVSVWFVLTDRLGNTEHGGGGWCSLIVEDAKGNVNVFTVLFGSDLWVMTTFIMILFLYTTTHCYLQIKRKEMKQSYGGHKPQLTLYSSDQKFLLIPLFFLLFRIGSVVFSILYVYTNLWRQMEYAWKMFVYYCMAIGDSGQGLVNGIIFCLLTPRVRRKLCPCNRQKPVIPDLKETSEQKKLLEKVDVSYSARYYSSSSPSVNSSTTSDED